MDVRNSEEKIVIIGATESFLAQSIMSELDSLGVSSRFIRARIKEIEDQPKEAVMAILFMSEELGDIPEVIVYLKDVIIDRDMGLIVISDEAGYDIVKETIPEQHITKWFPRPLDIDSLMKRIETFLDENTAEKRKKTILIVDDDITYMRTVYEWLKDSYHIGMASNGVQAISYLARNKADLILLDYEMPVANGPQVLSMLKDDSETGQIPVMFLTGHGDIDSVISVMGLSPVDYLLKTIDRETLHKRIDDFFISKKS